MARKEPESTAIPEERALLVGVDLGPRDKWSSERSMAELARLVETDGAEVVGEMTQRLAKPVPKTFIGSGKAQELAETCRTLDVDVVVFDEELTPSQQSNLERIVGERVKVIDRTALILDIFGRHATTREGRLQVQLAQLQYLLPRLRGMWSHLMGEQTRGGIGSRFGQGESQLEVDRRLVRDRIAHLRHELERLESRRQTQAKARWDSGVYRVALAGYTNAGKSTLLNALTGAAVYAKDELFATLDPTTRSIDLAEGRRIVITDTVGFIQKLPTGLVESFKSTLAEVRAANLIVVVADGSDEDWSFQLQSVKEVLDQVGAADIPRLLCINKVDLMDEASIEAIRLAEPKAVFVSAKDDLGLDGLLHAIAEAAADGDVTLTALIPFSKGMLMRMVHERCQVIRETYQQEGLLVTARVSQAMAQVLAPYVQDGEVAATRDDGVEGAQRP